MLLSECTDFAPNDFYLLRYKPLSFGPVPFQCKSHGQLRQHKQYQRCSCIEEELHDEAVW